ncbi:hypothetical protein LDO31_01350 [Luteimonas sp. XNQY3]|nr:hypothetical protein [Luteimonas sp. XNQY3]MCD9004899.1 hypothetical protein [Luteimonas sp. XNQY3]
MSDLIHQVCRADCGWLIAAACFTQLNSENSMKNRMGKVAAAITISLALSSGSVFAQGFPGPSEPCIYNGQQGVVETNRGQRHFTCWEGQWEFSYECWYSDGPGSYCVIL